MPGRIRGKENAMERCESLENLPCALFCCREDEPLTLTYMNERFLELTGYTRSELAALGNSLAALIPPSDLKVLRGGGRSSDGGRPGEVEYRLRRRDRSVLWLSERSRRLPDGGFLCAAMDITARIKDIELLKSRADKDSLTGLLNRMAFQEQATEYLTGPDSRPSAVLILDVDDFKEINDVCGHLTADTVLIEMAAALRRSFRLRDLVGRIGGDEIMVLLKDIESPDDVSKKIRAAQAAVAKCGVRLQLERPVTCSVGAAMAPLDGTDFSELYRKADEALYQVKAAGKNGLMLYQNLQAQNTLPYCHKRTDIDSDRELSPSSADSLIGHVFKLLFESAGPAPDPLERLLHIIGRKLDASAVCLLEPGEGDLLQVSHEWLAESVTMSWRVLPLKALPREEPERVFARTTQQLPPALSNLTSPGVKCLLGCRLELNGRFLGCLLAADCAAPHLRWTEDQTALLARLSRLIELYIATHTL